MQIPLTYADAVIGTSGANISYIRRVSGASIAIQETRGVPGEMTVEISGSASQVQTAQQLIQVPDSLSIIADMILSSFLLTSLLSLVIGTLRQHHFIARLITSHLSRAYTSTISTSSLVFEIDMMVLEHLVMA